MKLLITGICGFLGGSLARLWCEAGAALEIHGIDNLSRAGSQLNLAPLKAMGVKVRHGDIRAASDFESLPDVDYVIDAAANPSVLAGVDGRSSSRQVVEHNLAGTVNMLEFCRARKAGFVLLSTSRVYAIAPLSALPVTVRNDAFTLDAGGKLPPGASAHGIDESFSTQAPISLYGATKLASEALALEYGEAFGFPVWVNRCGVLAGAGQFGHAEQGIFSFWLHSWLRRRPLKYLGFGGLGHQVRDVLHPADVLAAIERQMNHRGAIAHRVCNFSGGAASAMSLANLSRWCASRWGGHAVAAEPAGRRYDIPWLVLDNRRAAELWQWQPTRSAEAILDEIARFAENHPDWLDISRA